MDAGEDAVRNTAANDAPWFVIPAASKGFTRIVVAAAVIDFLSSLDLRFPKVNSARRTELAEVRETVLSPE